jgi:hypothetical protein
MINCVSCVVVDRVKSGQVCAETVASDGSSRFGLVGLREAAVAAIERVSFPAGRVMMVRGGLLLISYRHKEAIALVGQP